MPIFSAETAASVFSTLAGAAMTALSLVYSIVLVVFTLAAGNIGPRLLERFSRDRTNQVAVGTLGALFLHSLFSLAAAGDHESLFPVAAACLLAGAAVILLLVFVDRVSSRVTIDDEIARIAADLDLQFRAEAAQAAEVEAGDLVRPQNPGTPIRTPKSGYVNRIAIRPLVARADRLGAFVDFAIRTGDHVLKGDVIGHATAGRSAEMAEEAAQALTIGPRRTAAGEICALFGQPAAGDRAAGALSGRQ